MNKNKNIIKTLYERNAIAQITNEKELTKILQSQSITLYCGFDPTSDSLHIGHLIPLLCLRRFQKFGHHPLIVLGGGTGLIGDPSFKNSERILNEIHIVEEWTEKIKQQISSFIDCSNLKKTYILNNYNWLSSIPIIDFLRKIGKFFSINKMIQKDSIKKRIQQNNQGISYTEFSYNLLQSYDFAHLCKYYNTILQIGGSDQWGNITTGIELIRRMYRKNTYGLTIPLITKPDNTKFGKTEKNTIWLDSKKTTPYSFYQHWINISDVKVYNFLKMFTEIDIRKINELQKEHSINCSIKPEAQTILAKYITQLVHGTQGLRTAQRITNHLFNGNILNLTINDFMQLAQDGIPTATLKIGTPLLQTLVASKLVQSITQARKLITSNGLTINIKKHTKTEYIFSSEDILYNQYTLLKRGKKKYFLIKWHK